MENNLYEVPFQVQTLIMSMLDKKERVHIRGNYRMRLEDIKNVIEKAISDYDNEMGTVSFTKTKKATRR